MPEEQPKQPEKIVDRVIEEEMKQSYLDYSMSVIVGRALPDVRDGLKPVHRRILFAMHDMGMHYNKPFKKSARIVGEVLGKYHPHGDTAVYDSMVRMAQDWSLRYQLIDGQGNFGSVDGDNPAAMRYTEARLKKIADELLKDIEKDTVNFTPNFDNSLKEPTVLPTAFPNLLVNGSSGIAVGMATNIPPHNMHEVCDGVIATIDNPDIEVNDLIAIIKGPDFPTGGQIMGRGAVVEAYKHGRGKIIVRSTSTTEQAKTKQLLILNEIPFMVNKSELIKEIADQVNDKKLTGISDIRDESDRDGMRIVIELGRDATPDIVLNQLYQHTRAQVTFGIIMLALVDNIPRVLNLKEMLEEFIKHRFVVVKRRTEYDLKQAEERQHIIQGIIIALDHIDEVVDGIKRSKTVDDAKSFLMSSYSLTEAQAKAILDMRLQRLASLEQQKIKDEHDQLTKVIAELKHILANDPEIYKLIKQDMVSIKKEYGDARKTSIVDQEFEALENEELIKPESMIITISHAGYIKRLPVATYRQQRRGGRGITAATTREEDFIEEIFTANTHDYVLCFTTKGKLHWLKVYQLPEASRTAKGSAIANLLQLEQGESLATLVPVSDFTNGYLMMITRNAVIKKTALNEFSNPRNGGIIAVGLKDNDELVSVIHTTGTDEIIVATKDGQAVRFNEEDIRPMGRQAAGVRGARLKGNDQVVSMVKVLPGMSLLTVTENGYGKRSEVEEYRLISRGGSGVKNIICSERNGSVVAVKAVTGQQDVMFITKNGITIRTPANDIRVIGRNAQGVRLMKLEDDDKVMSAAIVEHEDADGTDNEDSSPDA